MSYRKKVQLYTCEICKEESDNKSFFDVHHVDENRANNMEYNLVTVCCNCHRKIHLKQITDVRWAMSTNGRMLLFESTVRV